jgi:LysR family glycine cleavage system transcriptional activator
MKGFGFLSHAYGPVVSPALFEAARRDPAQLLWLPRLHSETFSSGWIRWASDVGVTLPPVSHEQAFEHNSYMLEAAIAGLGIAVTAWAFAQADIVEGRLIAPWGFQPLPTRFTYLQPALTENTIATNFGTWLRAEGRRDLKPPAAQLSLPRSQRGYSVGSHGV